MDNTSSPHEKIMRRIHEKKNELGTLVRLYGISDYQVLRCSQELDRLIYQIQEMTMQIKDKDRILEWENGGNSNGSKGTDKKDEFVAYSFS